MSEWSINGSSCPMDFQVPGELSTSKHRCATFPRFSYFIQPSSLLSQIFPYEHEREHGHDRKMISRPKPLPVSSRECTQPSVLFCFVQMNLSTSTLVLLNRSSHDAWNIDRRDWLVIIEFPIWRCWSRFEDHFLTKFIFKEPLCL